LFKICFLLICGYDIPVKIEDKRGVDRVCIAGAPQVLDVGSNQSCII